MAGVSVGAVIEPTPDLSSVDHPAEDSESGLRQHRHRPVGRKLSGPGHCRQQRRTNIRPFRLGPPTGRSEQIRTRRQERLPSVEPGSIENEALGIVVISLTWRLQSDVKHGCQGIEAASEDLPALGREAITMELAFEQGEEEELGGEAVIGGGQLTIDPVGESLADESRCSMTDLDRSAQRGDSLNRGKAEAAR